MYDVTEKEEARHDVHQDNDCSDTEHVVQEDDDNEVYQNIPGGEATIVEGNLDQLIRSKKHIVPTDEVPSDEDSDVEEEDDTMMQYCSDGGAENLDDMSLDDSDDDF
jgi:hypothetical protein